MARMQLQVLRGMSSLLNSSSLEGLGAICRGFASNSYTFSSSSVGNKERSSKVVSATWDVFGHKYFEASGIRTLSAESNGKGGDGEAEKRHQSTKIDGGQKYSVVQIDSDGSWRTVWRNAAELVSA